MQRGIKISQKDSNQKRNDENINLISQISEFDIQCNTKKEQLYENAFSSQLATKVNFAKKKQNISSPFIQGISIYQGYGVSGQKKSSNNRNSLSQQSKSRTQQQDTQLSSINTQQSYIIGDDQQIKNQQQFMSQEFASNIYNSYDIQQQSNNSLAHAANEDESRTQTCSTSSCSQINYTNQNGFSTVNSASLSNNNDIVKSYTAANENDESGQSHSIIDLSQTFIDTQKKPVFQSIGLRSGQSNSFRGGKNQQETQEKIKRIRLRNHQSAMRGSSVQQQNSIQQQKSVQSQSRVQQQNSLQHNGGNNYAKLLKMAEGEVKEKSKQAIEAIKNKLAINAQNESVLVLKTQPQIYHDEDYQHNLNIYQPNQTGNHFPNKKKNSCILNDSSMPFKPISQNCNRPNNQQMNKTHASGFSMSGDKKNSLNFQLNSMEANIQKQNLQNLNNLSISTLCITPNKSFSGKPQNQNLNRSIENIGNSKSDSKQNFRGNDENRKSLYKRMQNYNTFMRGKYAFHKLNKQKKQLCNISNVLYNSLLENYEVDGMLKTYNPLLQTAQPKKRIYDADDDANCENDSPDFNHMRKYYNKKYGIKLQQIVNEKTDKLYPENTGKYRNSYSQAYTPVKKNKEVQSSKKNAINHVSLPSSANQKYYSQSATTHEDNNFSQIYTENLLNQSCTDFLNLCNSEEISQMFSNQSNLLHETDSNDNNSSVQLSKRNNHNQNNNLQNFTQIAAAAVSQVPPQQRRRLTSGTKQTKKKNDIDIMPWGNDLSPISMI